MDALIGWMGAGYPWVKAVHAIFVIFWMAGLFMLPRFLVYHQESASGSAEAAAWVTREARLVAIILNPSMVVVWALGLALVVNIGAANEWWFRIKFVMVVGLTAYQMWMTRYAQRLAHGEARASGRTLRLMNEIPSLATIVIVLMVIAKPF